MLKSWAGWAAWLGVALLALALRGPDLGRRPLHHDEAVNALLLQRLWERGEYRYDPDEYHGPTLHYAALAWLKASGARDFDGLADGDLRWVTVAAGMLMVGLVGLLRDALGRTGAVLAALLLAASPAMVFYSRYFIHEMLLACFTLLLVGGAWRWRVSGSMGWALVTGADLGLMHATKETFVLTLAALALAAGVVAFDRTRRGVAGEGRPPWRPPRLQIAAALLVALAVSLLLFTSFGTNPRGPWDSVLTYLPWVRRAGGHSTHLHPWHWYFERLFWFRSVRGPVWSEALIGVLAVAGAWCGWTGRGLGDASRGFARFLVVHAVAMTGVYVAIAYKTPWCLVNFLLPGCLLAGLGTVALGRLVATRPRIIVVLGVALAVGVAHLGWQAWRASHSLVTLRSHPYAYSQTVEGVRELADRVEAIARIAPTGTATEVKVIAPDSAYWPLPWYLRRLRNVWWLDALPENPYAPIVLVAAGMQAGLDEKSNKRHLSVGYYELRPREFFELYVEFELWKRFVASLPRPREEPEDAKP